MALRATILFKHLYKSAIPVITSANLKFDFEKYHNYTRQENARKFQKYFLYMAGALGLGTGLLVLFPSKAKAESSLEEFAEDVKKYGAKKRHLPEYTLDDVAKHSTEKTRVWVAFRHGVYDITDFIPSHPGNLSDKDVGVSVRNMDDPFGNEPKRHIALKPATDKPFNAESPSSILADNFITPKNHLPVPHISPNTYELEIEGEGIKTVLLKLNDLKKFKKHTVTSTIQCAGNRRGEMIKVKPVKGLVWGHAAISNATWGGARLYDVLRSAGIDENTTSALHVQFEGYDTDVTSSPYGASIPIEKAMDPRGDVLLAYEMNGEPLPVDHGFPVRVVVPGVAGARNVKWLSRIVVSNQESDAHWQQNDYKSFAPTVDWDTVDFSTSPAIQDMPVTSAICDPVEGSVIQLVDGKIRVQGYAYSGGGRKIIRVDVSADGGKTWYAADQLTSNEAVHPRAWAWTLWTAYLPVAKGAKSIQLAAKAIDSQYNTQPEKFENIWNLRGVLSNAYHRVNVKVHC